ncbi:MAG: hypothetical protein KA185_19230, partial [Vitreoscilla sp.]|nr:hypothetical protein [Vitreoscilla sp.]
MHLDSQPASNTRPFLPTQPMPAAARAGSGPAEVGMGVGVGMAVPKASFTSSMQADLRKLADMPRHCSALAVVAASVRHSHPMSLQVQIDDAVTRLTVFPRERQFLCDWDLCALPRAQMARLRLVQVEARPPLYAAPAAPGLAGSGPLGSMLWQLAKHGPTDELLPEIAGPAVYRLSPALHLTDLPLDPELAAVLQQMRQRPHTVDELAAKPGFSRARVCRMLNAVYLQAGLIVTRSLP